MKQDGDGLQTMPDGIYTVMLGHGGTSAASLSQPMKVETILNEAATSGEPDHSALSINNWLGDEERERAVEALHSIRNRLTAIFGFAELARAGSQRAQQILLHEIADRTDVIRFQLDVIDAAVRRHP